MKKTSTLLITLVVLILLVGFVPLKKDAPTKLSIGVIAPLSGPAGVVGEEVKNAVALASSTALNLMYEDDQCDAKKAISSYRKLTQEGTRVFYIACSGSVIALAPLAKADNNLIVTGYAGSSEIRKTGDEVIRFIPDALSIAGVMADYALKLPEGTKIGLFHEEQDYSKSVALSLQEKLGSKIIATERYTATDMTFRTQIAKLKSAGINALFYVPTSDKAVQLVYKELKTLKYSPLIIGDVNTCEYPYAPKDYGLKAVCFDSGFTVETDGYKQFLDLYKSTYGVASSAAFYDAVTYDIIHMIGAFAQSQKGSFDVRALKKYILGGVDGLMARYTFTPEGEIISEGYLKMFEK